MDWVAYVLVRIVRKVDKNSQINKSQNKHSVKIQTIKKKTWLDDQIETSADAERTCQMEKIVLETKKPAKAD